MGGTKRKIKIENIERKDRKTVAFTKRKEGLFRKASKLCLLSPATQIAILATPLTANSHASFYSLGHPSADHVVSSFLNGQPPLPPANQENKSSSGLGFWWEEKGFDISDNVDELNEAANAVYRTLNHARLRLDDAVKSNQRGGSLVIHQEDKEVLRLGNEDTNQIPKFQGETSGSASLLKNEEDTLHIDDFFTDFHIEPF